MTSIVEEIVDLTVSREQLLCVPHRSKPLRFSFSSPYRNVRAFGAIILAASDVLKVFQA